MSRVTYRVYDSTGSLVRGGFDSYKEAFAFCQTMQRFDWTIKKVEL